MNIPFFNYPSRFQCDREYVKNIVFEVGRTGNFILRDKTVKLESTIAKLSGVKFACAVGCGTQGLLLALAALGVGPGTEVLTPAFSFIASASTIALLGAKPIFVDVDLSSATIDPSLCEHSIGKHTKAIMAVHLFCSLAKMRELATLCKDYNIFLIEDSAVAFGARFGDHWAGTIGDAGVFSFFPAKPLGGIGEAGMIVTNSKEIDEKCRWLRNHGQDGKIRFLHHLTGYNHRMDEITATYLAHKITLMDKILTRRKEIALQYAQAFWDENSMITPIESNESGCIYYNYAVRVTNRERFLEFMANRGIETKIFYSIPLHLQPVFKNLGYRPGQFPNAEQLSRECIALPLYPEMTDRQVSYVIESAKAYEHSTIKSVL